MLTALKGSQFYFYCIYSHDYKKDNIRITMYTLQQHENKQINQMLPVSVFNMIFSLENVTSMFPVKIRKIAVPVSGSMFPD